MRKKNKSNRLLAFATIELPVVLLIFGLTLLFFAPAIYVISSNLAWFLKITGGFLVVISILLLTLIFWPHREKD